MNLEGAGGFVNAASSFGTGIKLKTRQGHNQPTDQQFTMQGTAARRIRLQMSLQSTSANSNLTEDEQSAITEDEVTYKEFKRDGEIAVYMIFSSGQWFFKSAVYFSKPLYVALAQRKEERRARLHAQFSQATCTVFTGDRGSFLHVPYDMGVVALPRDGAAGQSAPMTAVLASALANALPEQQRTMLGGESVPVC